MTRPGQRRSVGWIAICAVLLQVLVPLVIHTRAVERAPVWLEVCSTEGIKRIAAPAARADEAPATPAANVSAHCFDCVTASTAHSAPPPVGILVAPTLEPRPANSTTAPTLAHGRTGASRYPARLLSPEVTQARTSPVAEDGGLSLVPSGGINV